MKYVSRSLKDKRVYHCTTCGKLYDFDGYVIGKSITKYLNSNYEVSAFKCDMCRYDEIYKNHIDLLTANMR